MDYKPENTVHRKADSIDLEKPTDRKCEILSFSSRKRPPKSKWLIFVSNTHDTPGKVSFYNETDGTLSILIYAKSIDSVPGLIERAKKDIRNG
jgi:hypothetical protein